MVALVTDIADKHLIVVTRLTAVLADFAVRTLPACSHHTVGINLRVQAMAVVVLATASTEQLPQDITNVFTDDTLGLDAGFLFGLVGMLGTQQR